MNTIQLHGYAGNFQYVQESNADREYIWNSSKIGGDWREIPLHKVTSISTLMLSNESYYDDDVMLYIPDHIAAYTYDDDPLYTSNYKTIERDFSDLYGIAWWDLSNGQIAIRADLFDDGLEYDFPHDCNSEPCASMENGCFFAQLRELVEAIASLDDYPIIDENLYSEIEHEQQEENWRDYGRSDFISALESHFCVDLSDTDDDAIDSLYWDSCQYGEYPYNEAGSTIFPENLENIDRETVDSLPNVQIVE